jgi:membrane associated rhomboid family serine protease
VRSGAIEASSCANVRAVTESQPATAVGSRRLAMLGIALVLVGAVIVFAGEFEVLPRDGMTAAIGGGVIGLGVFVYLRSRLAKTQDLRRQKG